MEKQLDPIVTKVRSIQREHGWTDAQLAERLGVARQLWGLTHAGQAALGLSLLSGIRVAFPELASEVDAALVRIGVARIGSEAAA
jgi:transcriptional regulator with XRE-family HTH domain